MDIDDQTKQAAKMSIVESRATARLKQLLILQMKEIDNMDPKKIDSIGTAYREVTECRDIPGLRVFVEESYKAGNTVSGSKGGALCLALNVLQDKGEYYPNSYWFGKS